MAARGYWQAFQTAKESIKKVPGQKPDRTIAGTVAESDHEKWFRKLFAPSVAAGILEATDLAGYRNHRVYIRHSKHGPPNHQAVRKLIPTFFDLLQNEKERAVRVVPGHYFFVYIHPYMDGNGRMGRFFNECHASPVAAIPGWLFQWSCVTNIWRHWKKPA